MVLNATLAGLMVLVIYLYQNSTYYPAIDLSRPDDVVALVYLILQLPVCAYIGAYVAAKVRNIE